MTRTMPATSAASATTRPEWMSRGLCTSAPDPDLWFPEPGQTTQPAIAVCARCPVADACLEYALSLPANPAGVWGGTTEEQRRDLCPAATRRRQARTAYLARPEVRERRRQRSAERRERLREAAAAGDPQAIATLERQRAAKRTPQALAAARRRTRARYQATKGDAA